MKSLAAIPDVTEVTKPVLVEIAGLRLVVAAYTDGFDYYLAQDELGEISWASRGGSPGSRRDGPEDGRSSRARPGRAPGQPCWTGRSFTGGRIT